MNDLYDTIRACPIREWLTRRLRAEIPLSSGNKAILSYSLPTRDEPMPIITWQQVREKWGDDLGVRNPSKANTKICQDIAENMRLQTVLEMQILQRQGEAVRDLLEVMVDNLDVQTILIALASFAESLLMSQEDAVAFGWLEWLERAHELYKGGD